MLIVSCSFLITHMYTTFLQQSSFNQLSCFLYIPSHPVIVLLLCQLAVGITPCPCWKTPKNNPLSHPASCFHPIISVVLTNSFTISCNSDPTTSQMVHVVHFHSIIKKTDIQCSLYPLIFVGNISKRGWRDKNYVRVFVWSEKRVMVVMMVYRW